ncbi:MAG: sterol desaturase family protein [Halioglobus sp.]
MEPSQYLLGLILVLFFVELLKGSYKNVKKNDWLINIISYIQENITRPLMAFGLSVVLISAIPDYAGALSNYAFWPTLIAFFLVQDLVHYWYHRIAHEWEPLWRIHRTHHSAPSMNVMVTSRLNFLWQLLMPVNYISGVAIYLGLVDIFLVWWIFRAFLNYLSHTEVRWDLPLYRIKPLKPILWIVEHIFTTPDAHHAHHGYGEHGNPMGNYAPVLIFWDFVFGTAKLPHCEQDKIGIDHDPLYPWYQQLWWPLFKLEENNAVKNVKDL